MSNTNNEDYKHSDYDVLIYRKYDEPNTDLVAIKSCTCLNNILGKVKQGSLIACIFNLSIFSLGVGLLALPQQVVYISLFMTPILIVMGGVINYWTLTILAKASKKYKLTKYENAVEFLFNKSFSYFFSFVMCVNKLGRIVILQMISYKFFGAALNKFFSLGYENMENFAKKSFWGRKKIKIIVYFLITYIIVFPLCLIKTISKMRYSSAVGVIALFLMIIIILIQFPSFYYHNIHQRRHNINFLNLKYGFDKNMHFFQAVSNIIYTFECHAGLFPVLSSLHSPTKKRVKKVIKNSILINAISCIIIALSGYLSQPFDTPELFIDRHAIFKHDFLIATGYLLFICTLVTKIGANYNGFRITILNLLSYDNENYPDFINIIITLLTLFFTTFIASCFRKKVFEYFNIIGTFCSIIVGVIIPGMIYIKGNNHYIYHYKNILVIIFILVVSFIGLITIYCSVKKIYHIRKIHYFYKILKHLKKKKLL